MTPITNTKEIYKAAIIKNSEMLNWLKKNYLYNDFSDIIKRLENGKPICIVSEKEAKISGSYFLKCANYYGEEKIISPHLIGYINSDGKGVSGIEKVFDDFLSSENYVTATYYLDARNKTLLGIEPVIKNVSNHDYKKCIVLTIDKEIQKICEDVAKNKLKTGSIVVQEISSGDIKALVSMPEFDVKNVGDYIKNPDSPLINRSFSSYNVGSIFKLCIALCALENGYDEDYKYDCSGKYIIGNTVYNCNKHEGHGKITMTEALSMSCNTYFINLAQNLGAKKVFETANKLGFGKSIYFASGYFTDKGNIPKLSELISSKGELANFAFGQGKLLASPIQINSMINTIISGGEYKSPRLIIKTVDKNGDIIEENNKSSEKVFDSDVCKKIQNMMINVIENGTGKNALTSFGGGGKTASAETGYKINGKKVTQCWFGGFFPKENPKYSITVLYENGKSGSDSAAPVFKSVAEKIAIYEGII